MLQCSLSFGFCNSFCGDCSASTLIPIVGLGLTVSSATYLARSSSQSEKDHQGILPVYQESPERWQSSLRPNQASRKSTARLFLVMGILLIVPFVKSTIQSHFQSQDMFGAITRPTPIFECQMVQSISQTMEASASVSCPLEYPSMTGCFGFTPDRTVYHGEIAVRASTTTCSSFSALDSVNSHNLSDTSVWVSAQCCRLHSPEPELFDVGLSTHIIRQSDSKVSCPANTTVLGCAARGNYPAHGTVYSQNGCEAKTNRGTHIITETSAVCGSVSQSESVGTKYSMEISCLTVSGVRVGVGEPVEATCPLGYQMTDCSSWDRLPIRGSKTYMESRQQGEMNVSRPVCLGLGSQSYSNVRVSARCCHVVAVGDENTY